MWYVRSDSFKPNSFVFRHHIMIQINLKKGKNYTPIFELNKFQHDMMYNSELFYPLYQDILPLNAILL